MERFLLNDEEGQYQNQEVDKYAIKLAFGSPIRAIAPPFLKGEQKKYTNRFSQPALWTTTSTTN